MLSFLRKHIFSFVVIIVLTSFLSVSAQYSQLRFETIGAEHGLSQGIVYCMMQDSTGFLWFGTQDGGLNKYDGKKFTVYMHDDDNPNSLSNNDITAIVQDSSGLLWLSTWGGGLNRFDPRTETFTIFRHQANNIQSVPSDYIQTLIIDHQKRLWVGTYDNGLALAFTFDKDSLIFANYRHNQNDENSLSDNRIWSMAASTVGSLWVGTENGLSYLDSRTNKWKRYLPNGRNNGIDHKQVRSVLIHSNGSIWAGTMLGINIFDVFTETFRHLYPYPNQEQMNQINYLFEDNKKNVWVGMQLSGVSIYDMRTQQFFGYQSSLEARYGLAYNNIRCVIQDRSNIVWIGTRGGGINKVDLKPLKFKHYVHNPNDKNSLINNNITCVSTDSEGRAWIGTAYSGVSIFTPNSNSFETLSLHPAELNVGTVRSIFCGSNNTVWIGTWDEGVYAYNYKQKTWTNYRNKPNDSTSISHNDVIAVYEDALQRVWVGTKNGLESLDKETGTFSLLQPNPNRRRDYMGNRVKEIFQETNGTLWVGTGDGLYLLSPVDKKFTRYQHINKDTTSLSSNKILAIFESSDHNLWIGTANGVNRYNRQTNNFEQVTLPVNDAGVAIYDILEDQQQRLWLCTGKGVLCFLPKDNTWRRFDIYDGLQDNDLVSGAAAALPEGLFILGGRNGFNSFLPQQISYNNVAPTPIISELLVNNQLVKVGSPENFQYNIAYTDRIELTYKQNFLTFRFAALEYSIVEKNSFAYKMDGIDETWRYTKQPEVSYSRLPAGEYVFWLKAANNDGVWNETPTRLEVYIKPPFWRTFGFYIIVFVSSASLLLLVWRLRERQLIREQHDLEQKVKERTAEIAKQKELLQHQAEQLEKLSIVARETENGVMIMDAQGNFEWFNEGFKKLYGYEYDEYIAKFGENILTASGNKEIKQIIDFCLKEKKSVVYDNRMATRKGKPVWVQTSLTPVLDYVNNIVKLVAIDTDITKVKEAEEEIRQKNEEIQTQRDEIEQKAQELRKLSLVASKTENGVALTNTEGYITWVNESFAEIYAEGKEELVGKHFSDISTNPYISTKIRRCLANKQAVIFDSLRIHNNVRRWIQTTLSPVLNDDGSVQSLIVLDSDISKIKEIQMDISWKNEELIRQRNEIQIQSEELKKLSLVASEINNAVTIMDAEGKIMWVNRSFGTMYGYSDEQLAELIGSDFMTISTNPLFLRKLNRCIRMKESVEFESLKIHESTRRFWIQTTLSPIADDDGEVTKVVAIDTDITKIKEAKMEITWQKDEIKAQRNEIRKQAQELKKLSIVASGTDNAVIITDNAGNMEWVNESFTRIYGYTLDEYTALFGSNIIENAQSDEIKQKIIECINEKRTALYETSATARSGRKIWRQTTLTPITNDDGEVTQLVAIDANITAIKEAEFEILQKNEEIQAQRDEIEAQRDIALQQRDLVTQQKNEITDSIHYAYRIQKAVLPPDKLIAQILPPCFVLYKPRDIVSGDFYWVAQKDNWVIYAAADCTGHGVPGAFMSLIGISFLNRIVNENNITEPAEILSWLRTNIVQALSQAGNTQARDGMDIAIVAIDRNDNWLQYAGANSPLYIIRSKNNERNEIIKLSPNKISIDGTADNTKTFTNQIFKLQPHDMLYLATDGVVDQFGGPHGKKLMTKRFVDLLSSVALFPISEQKEALEKHLTDWINHPNDDRKSYDQVDDIMVMGIQIQ